MPSVSQEGGLVEIVAEVEVVAVVGVVVDEGADLAA